MHQKDGVTIRKINYAYDVFGNVATQELNNGMADNTPESFSYDNLHRLTQSLRIGTTSKTVIYGYDAAGNFNFKSDLSLATGTPYNLSTGGLGGGGANAVKSVSLKAVGTRIRPEFATRRENFHVDSISHLSFAHACDFATAFLAARFTIQPKSFVMPSFDRNIRLSAIQG